MEEIYGIEMKGGLFSPSFLFFVYISHIKEMVIVGSMKKHERICASFERDINDSRNGSDGGKVIAESKEEEEGE